MSEEQKRNRAESSEVDSCTVHPAPHTPKSPSGDLELRSEEMQDILTRPPHILVRSGISVICGVVILLIAVSFFFKYPDIIVGEAVITTENPPVWLVAKTTGKIKELNCTDNSRVRQGQILAVIDNPALTTNVVQVKSLLNQCVINDTALFFPAELGVSSFELGNIQNTYSTFLKTITNYDNFLSFNSINKEKEALNLQISGHKRYSSTLEKQWHLKQEELEIAQATFDREKQLFNKGIIAQAELEAAENALLNTRQSLQQLQTSMASDQIEAAQLSENVSKLDIQYIREKNSLLSDLKTAYSELLSAIENWEQIYVLVSPIAGTVTFDSFWTSNQFVNAGDKVLAVVPDVPGEIIGRIQTPAVGSGKIKTGQRVNIKINDYPYMEYGSLQGEVRNISLISNGKNYAVEVKLRRGLQTSIGKKLDFAGELTGTAEIMTDDRSLFSRIFSPLKYLINNHIRD
ncbi:hemolysin [Bacteroidia bacterium]|nr:hemolysin [Bacteroidia bacterium]